jgi:trehalose 6-phosphate synthase
MKLIVISNRLPLTIKKGEHGFEYKQASGGLVTGIKSIKDTIRFKWLGNISGA